MNTWIGVVIGVAVVVVVVEVVVDARIPPEVAPEYDLTPLFAFFQPATGTTIRSWYIREILAFRCFTAFLTTFSSICGINTSQIRSCVIICVNFKFRSWTS